MKTIKINMLEIIAVTAWLLISAMIIETAHGQAGPSPDKNVFMKKTGNSAATNSNLVWLGNKEMTGRANHLS
jgi:hypothetical protein